MKKKKYVCYSGLVYTSTGQTFVSSFSLPTLYGIDPADCIMAGDPATAGERLRGLNLKEYIHLYPRSDGDYTLKENL